MLRRKRKYLLWIGVFIVVFFVLPNLVNFREQEFFSEKRRLEKAREASQTLGDSITVVPGEYYKRGKFHYFFFGKKNRDLWTTPITVKVMRLDTIYGGMQPYDIGGSQQTISVRAEDYLSRHWALRSVNKDQQNALPDLLRHSALRFMFRDQVAAMNPYAPLIVASLAQTINLPHLNPQMFWMPYNEKHGKYNQKIAGRLVYLEEHLDTTWIGAVAFSNPISIIDTEDMVEMQEKQKIPVDTMLYLKSRLFDMLIGDWDRHEGQWRWALIDSSGKKMFKPIAKDRDMAMYVFDEGIVSHLTLAVNPKFQSFRKDISSVRGLMKQSRKMDKRFLKGLPEQQFIALANEIQQKINVTAITKALQAYPPNIYQQIADKHQAIFLSRLQQLDVVAKEFHQLVND